jgi:hypothetical protein
LAIREKIPRLDFVPNPADYRPADGNRSYDDNNDATGKARKIAPRNSPYAIDLSPRLELSAFAIWELEPAD